MLTVIVKNKTEGYTTTLPSETKLTPTTARYAAQVVFGSARGAEVWTLPQGTPEGLDYSEVYGYKLYPNSHRKLWAY